MSNEDAPWTVLPDRLRPVGNDRVHTFRVGGNMVDSYHEPESGRLVELTVSLWAD